MNSILGAGNREESEGGRVDEYRAWVKEVWFENRTFLFCVCVCVCVLSIAVRTLREM